LASHVTVREQTGLLRDRRLRSLVDRARNRLTPAVARRRDDLGFRALTAVSKAYLDMVANVSFDIEVNGELSALRALDRPACLFDVGANVGDWSIAAAGLFPQARIEAFEIVPDTAAVMRRRLTERGISTVNVHSVGLSDEEGTARVAYLPDFSQGSSAAVVQAVGDVQWRECEVETGDDWCEHHGIVRIDFLKLDVEGLEGRVLRGFARMLGQGVIDVIQFEYGHLNASVRFLLGDFYELLDGYGYEVGKIFPDGVDFHPYDASRDETFRGPNYLAVHRSHPELIARLSASK
jgi:FkbM family methyltransferase